ncbi:MAG: hypothetical protein RR348_01240 [Clostridia bacterium]
MIINQKKSIMPKPVRKKMLLSSFAGYDEDKVAATLPCDYTDDCYNFAFKNNKLVAKIGVSPLKIVADNGRRVDIAITPTIKGKCNFFVGKNSNKLSNYTTLVLSHDGGVETLELAPNAVWQHIACPTKMIGATPYLFGERELLLMSDGVNGIKVLENNTITTLDNALVILDMCAHYERIFAVVNGKRNSLWFSDAFDPFNWNVSISEGGYIEFDGSFGNINIVKSFREYLYVFCDYGIYRLTALADQTQFSLKKLYCACGKIFAKSVVDCGDKIAFVSSDGIYFFDGYEVSHLAVGVSKLLEGGFENVAGAYCNHKYYVSLKNRQIGEFDFDRSLGDNNMLVVCDMLTRNIDINKGVFVENIFTLCCPNQNCVVGVCKDCGSVVEINDKGKYLDKQIVRKWQVKNIDFGNHIAQKVVRAVEYSAKNQFIFGIVTDSGNKAEFVLSPKEKYKSVNIKGNSFDFFVESDLDNVEIASPKIVVDFLK